MVSETPVRVTPHQALCMSHVLNSPHRFVIWPGSGGAGKTWGAVLAMMYHALQYPRPLMLLGGKSADVIMGNLGEPMYHWADVLGLGCVEQGAPRGYVTGPITWEVRGLADAQSYRRIQGRTYHGAIIDELTNIHPDAWDMCQTRLRAPGAKGILTFNKLGPRHWTKRRVRDQAEALRAVIIESLISDNPTLPEDYVESITQEGVLSAHQRARLVDNLDATPEGQVYPQWTSEEQQAARELKGQPCRLGADYGASSVTAAVYAQRKGSRWVVTGEYYWDANVLGPRDSNKHAEEIRKRAPGRITHAYVDPSAIDLQNALRKQKIPTTGAWNDARGYNVTDGLLQRKQLTIVEDNCPSLCTELEDLVYNANQTLPDPSCIDHATDSLRYLACGIADTLGASYVQPRYRS